MQCWDACPTEADAVPQDEPGILGVAADPAAPAPPGGLSSAAALGPRRDSYSSIPRTSRGSYESEQDVRALSLSDVSVGHHLSVTSVGHRMSVSSQKSDKTVRIVEPGDAPPDQLVQMYRRDLREIFDEWGQKHTEAVCQAFRAALGPDRRFTLAGSPTSSLATSQGRNSGAPRLNRSFYQDDVSRTNSNRSGVSYATGSSATAVYFAEAQFSESSHATPPGKRSTRGTGFSRGLSASQISDESSVPTIEENEPVLGGVSYVTASSAAPVYPTEGQSSAAASSEYTSAAGKEKILPGFGLSALRTGPAIRQKIAASLVRNRLFEVLSASAIIFNSVLIGWRADYNIEHVGRQCPPWAYHAELFFTAFFVSDVVLKLIAYDVSFFCGRHWVVNLFDLALAVEGLVEAVTQKENFLRVIRLVKLLRYFRAVPPLRSCHAFTLLAASIMDSAGIMFWSMSLLAGFTYVFASILVQAGARFLQTAGLSAEDERSVRLHWGSVRGSMLSLLMAGTGGQLWGDIADPLFKVGTAAYCLFLFYLGIFVFCLTNAVGSVFVASTLRRTERDNVLMISHELEKKDGHVAKLVGLFEECDSDKDGVISHDDFVACLSDTRMEAFAASLGLETTDTVAFFKIMTGNMGECIGIEAFVEGCIKLRGHAKAVDMYTFFEQQKSLTAELKADLLRIEHRLSEQSLNRPKSRLTSGSNLSHML